MLHGNDAADGGFVAVPLDSFEHRTTRNFDGMVAYSDGQMFLLPWNRKGPGESIVQGRPWYHDRIRANNSPILRQQLHDRAVP